MEAIVLAGGFGTRLSSVVRDVPKPMAPIAGRPFLEVLLTRLARQGVRRVILSIGFKGRMIQDHFGASFSGIELVYVQEHTPLGTGGAVRAALERCRSEWVFVLNGDTYSEVDLHEVEKLWGRHGNPIIVARRVEESERYGALKVHGEVLLSFDEKSTSGLALVNAGCYFLPVSLKDSMELPAPFSLETDFLAVECKRREFNVWILKGMFIDIGVPADYLRAQQLLGDNKY